MKIGLLFLSSIFADVIKKAQNSPKMAIAGPDIFFTSTSTSGFRFRNNKFWMDGKPVDQGVLGRKYLRNLAFGFLRVPFHSYGKGLKIWFSPLHKKPVCFSVLTKSKKQIHFWNLHQILNPGKLHQISVMTSSSGSKFDFIKMSKITQKTNAQMLAIS